MDARHSGHDLRRLRIGVASGTLKSARRNERIRELPRGSDAHCGRSIRDRRDPQRGGFRGGIHCKVSREAVDPVAAALPDPCCLVVLVAAAGMIV